jgi:hypothetical protein
MLVNYGALPPKTESKQLNGARTKKLRLVMNADWSITNKQAY